MQFKELSFDTVPTGLALLLFKDYEHLVRIVVFINEYKPGECKMFLGVRHSHMM